MKKQATETKGTKGAKSAETPPSATPPGRRTRCTRPRHVLRQLVQVANDLRDGALEYQTGNALTNCYRVILQALNESEIEKRVLHLENAVARALSAARADS